jgi:hypothetical protein
MDDRDADIAANAFPQFMRNIASEEFAKQRPPS